MTPEREAYEKAKAELEYLTMNIRQELLDLIRGAEALELVLTIETGPLWPLEMGHYDMVGSVRPARARYQRLAQLQAAAEKSEQNALDCAAGIHSWSGELGKLPPDTKCSHCGELYGDPS